MITRIEALNYRCLRDVRQDVPPFAILVGPNASGKSTFLDVLGFVSDLVNDGLEKAVLKRGRSVQELTWKGEGDHFELGFEFPLPPSYDGNRTPSDYRLRYELVVSTTGISVEVVRRQNTLSRNSQGVFQIGSGLRSVGDPLSVSFVHRSADTFSLHDETTSPMTAILTGSNDQKWRVKPDRTVLREVPEDPKRHPTALWLKEFLSESIRTIALNSLALRTPSSALLSSATMRVDGSNLPQLISRLAIENPERYRSWLQHIQVVLDDVESISVREREEDRARYIVIHYRNGAKVPSWLVSDGTLRFLALTLLAYLPDKNRVYLIEEPENGIHPLAIEAVYQSLSSAYDAQIFVATHSPMFVGLAKPEEILCFSRDEDGGTNIVRGSEHPHLRDWKGEVNLGVLYASGVLG